MLPKAENIGLNKNGHTNFVVQINTVETYDHFKKFPNPSATSHCSRNKIPRRNRRLAVRCYFSRRYTASK